ncbi:hypothetical protein BD779DRAFT_1498029 [Infundibulicybe gibba]|nr:hypothetical protein BD779DRAFT_1498029 [Infundibulicybe gibba]
MPVLPSAWFSTAPTNTNTPTNPQSDSDAAYPLPSSVEWALVGSFILGAGCTLGLTRVYTRYARRIRNGDWITPEVFAERRWVKGVVTNVGDADNFRLFHTPPLGGWSWPLKFRRIPVATKDLQNNTIHIRIAGADAPEAAHFGRPAQPHAPESLAWLRSRILGKRVKCQLIKRDQYSRVVAAVLTPSESVFSRTMRNPRRSLALEMIRAGCGTTYQQAGADYAPWGKDAFLRIEEEARSKRRGMWKHGVDSVETPGEYKRRHAAGSDSIPEGKGGKDTKEKGSKFWKFLYWDALGFMWPK